MYEPQTEFTQEDREALRSAEWSDCPSTFADGESNPGLAWLCILDVGHSGNHVASAGPEVLVRTWTEDEADK